jgi:succinylglutamate desuccinylase
MQAERRTNTHSRVCNVAIVGGTHGNECNGVHLARFFLQPRGAEQVRRASFTTTVLLANPDAIAAQRCCVTPLHSLPQSVLLHIFYLVKHIRHSLGRRYVDTDMNRCFLLHDLADPSLCNREQKRAKEIDAILGPKSSANPATDFIIDLHNTTSG